MVNLIFFLFFSLLASIPEILNSLLGTEINNITTIGILCYLLFIFLYSLYKGYKHKISYVIFSLVYWCSTLGITFYFYTSGNRTLFYISSLLNLTPMSAIIVVNDIYTSILLIFFLLLLIISVGFCSGYFFKNLTIYNNLQKKYDPKTNTSKPNTANS